MFWVAGFGLYPAHAIAALHPQDGPHADIRIDIETNRVFIELGLNLAFMDEIAPSYREALYAVDETEVQPIIENARRFLLERNSLRVNGEDVTPQVLFENFLHDPDPGQIPLFPLYGKRALYLYTTELEFTSDDPIRTVEMTWTGYPRDALAVQIEGPDTNARLVLQARVTGEGRFKVHQFSMGNPTMVWRSDLEDGQTALDLLPKPPKPKRVAPKTAPVLSIGLGGLGVIAGLVGVVALTRGRGRIVPLAVASLAGIGALLTLDGPRMVITPGYETSAVLGEEEAEEVFLVLHGNLYRAFGFTEREEVYDALATALHTGPLLDRLYTDIRDGLVQAENDGEQGHVTWVEPVETRVLARSTRDGEPTFEVEHSWLVDGTVYHMGHSHTRRHEYLGTYRVSATDKGWRIIDHQMIRQDRVPIPGDDDPLYAPPTILREAPPFDPRSLGEI